LFKIYLERGIMSNFNMWAIRTIISLLPRLSPSREPRQRVSCVAQKHSPSHSCVCRHNTFGPGISVSTSVASNRLASDERACRSIVPKEFHHLNKSEHCVNYFNMNMILNDKYKDLNKVVDLVEFYNFHIKFLSI
jgi:hypothetical protein